MCMLNSFYLDKLNDIETALIYYDTTTVVNKMKEKYVEFWRHKTTKSSKLYILSMHIQKGLQNGTILTCNKNPTTIRTFTQFRISNHKLQIERE